MSTCAKRRRKRIPAGRISGKWNTKITDENFIFYGCAVCEASFKVLSDLSSHIHKFHRELRDRSYKKNKQKKAIQKKNKPYLSLEIKPEDGYIGDKEASEANINITSDNDNINEEKSSGQESLDKLFKCLGCNKLFLLGYYLHLHVLSHKDERNHVCSSCGASFFTAHKRKIHIKTMHTVQRNQCRVCFRKFIGFDALKVHFHKNHKQQVMDGEVYEYAAIVPYLKDSLADDNNDLHPYNVIEDNKVLDAVNKTEKKEIDAELKLDFILKLELEDSKDDSENSIFEETKVIYNSDKEDTEIHIREEISDVKDDKIIIADGHFPTQNIQKEPLIIPLVDIKQESETNVWEDMDTESIHIKSEPVDNDEKEVFEENETVERDSEKYLDILPERKITNSNEKKGGIKVEIELVEEKNNDSQKEIKKQRKKTTGNGNKKISVKKKCVQERNLEGQKRSQRKLNPTVEARKAKSFERDEKGIFTCAFCLKIINNRYNMENHVRTHTGEKPYRCQVCDVKFISASAKYKHMLTHKVKEEKQEPAYNLNSKSNLSPEMESGKAKSLEPTEEGIFTCAFCNKNTKIRYNMEKHVKTHTGEKPYMCHFCGEEFISASDKYEHITTTHSVRTEPEESADKLSSQPNLPIEIDVVKQKSFDRNENGTFTCAFCNMVTKKRYNMENHVRTHTGEKPYKCHLCDVKFISASAKYKHMLTHKGIINTEPQEPAESSNSEPYLSPSMEADKAKSLERTTDGRFTCAFCNRVMRKRYNMENHVRTHTGEKPYKCHVCDISFISASTKRKHMLTHTAKERKMCAEKSERPPRKDINNKMRAEKYKLCKINADGTLGCKVCKTKKKTLSLMRNHLKTHTVVKRFICDICGKKYESKSKIAMHLQTHKVKVEKQELADKLKTRQITFKHNDDGTFTCEICNKVLKTRSYTKIHKMIHTGEKPYKCHYCDKHFVKVSRVYRHISQVHKDKNFKEEIVDDNQSNSNTTLQNSKKTLRYHCNYCSKSFLYRETLSIHNKIHEGPNPNITCRYCLQEFDSKEFYDRHRERHSEKKPYMCSVCGLDFKKKYSMLHHKTQHDQNVTNLTCDICSKTVKSKNRLITHLAAHCRYVLEFTCPVCKHIFNTKYNMKKHLYEHLKEGLFDEKMLKQTFVMILENVKKIPSQLTLPGTSQHPVKSDNSLLCNICGEFFTEPLKLLKHIYFHNTQNKLNENVGEEKVYTCKVCNKGFKLPYLLKCHSETHLEKKTPIVCQQCGKTFSKRLNLRRHIHEFHNGDRKKYDCLICSKSFTRIDYLKIHSKTKHGVAV